MNDEDSNGYRLQNILTNLAVRVGQLEGTMKTFMENWAIQDKLAHEARRVMYERIELLGRQVERVATDVNNVQQDVAEIKKEIDEEVTPVIKSFEIATAKKHGAKGVWAVIGGGLIAVASGLAYVMDKVSGYMFPKP